MATRSTSTSFNNNHTPTGAQLLGFPTDKNNVDSRAGFLALTLRDTLNDIVVMQAWLTGQTDAQLITLGYTAPEVTLLRASFVDLSNLANIAHGQGVQPAQSNFFWNAQHLTGLS